MAAAEATTHVAAAAEATTHVAAAEPATVSTAATPARKCISGQSSCESRSHRQNNHDFAYHLTAPSTRLRVR
jgi:hypothetical protein